MGYRIDFRGNFKVTPALSPAHRLYLKAFSESRRIKRDEAKTTELFDDIREIAGLPVGRDGCYCTVDHGIYCTSMELDILGVVNYNSPPADQPSLWCDWEPNEDGTAIEWNGSEKFYEYVEWLQYIIEHFLERWGYKLNGKVLWIGEDHYDVGEIIVANNKVAVRDYFEEPA